MKICYSSVQSLALTDCLSEIQTVINWLGLASVWDMSCVQWVTLSYAHQDLPFNNAMRYLLHVDEYRVCLLHCYHSRAKLGRVAVQSSCCTYVCTKKVRGGHPRVFSLLKIDPFRAPSMSMVSMVGSTSCWQQLLCITSLPLSALWSLTSLQK